MEGETWEAWARSIVLNELAKRGWQLVQDQVGFEDAVFADVRARVFKNTAEQRVALERATVRHYCVILHTASGKPGSWRQRRAFEELRNYLYPIALYKTHNTNLAQDVTQQALVKIWKNHSQCREPKSFLSWTTLILINEIREYFRGKPHPKELAGEFSGDQSEITESDMNRSDAEEKAPPLELLAISNNEGLGNVMADETQQELGSIIKKCIKNPQQQRVLIESFLNDKGYKEIAEELGITVGNVHVLKHRALNTLRKCDTFISYVEENLT